MGHTQPKLQQRLPQPGLSLTLAGLDQRLHASHLPSIIEVTSTGLHTSQARQEEITYLKDVRGKSWRELEVMPRLMCVYGNVLSKLSVLSPLGDTK